MIGILLKEGENIETALKRFKGECMGEGIHSEIKRREYFEKPSEIKKRKMEASLRKKKRKNFGTGRKFFAKPFNEDKSQSSGNS